MDDLAARVWAWLPARFARDRVTAPSVIAAHLGVDAPQVLAVLAEMEHGGHAIRDRAVGPRTGWHRGTPLPALSVTVEEMTLWP